MFLDDSESRCHSFWEMAKTLCSEKGVTLALDIAYSAADANRLLADQKQYDVACFDHDLCEEHYKAQCIENMGGEDFTYGEVPTGLTSAEAAMDLEVSKRPLVGVAHSMNTAGRLRIFEYLRDHDIDTACNFPFSIPIYKDVLRQVIDKLILPRQAQI